MKRYTTWMEHERGPYYLVSDVDPRITALETALRKIMAEAAGVSAQATKEFHRECLNSVRTIALLALEGKS